jgi:hypothetical protein
VKASCVIFHLPRNLSSHTHTHTKKGQREWEPVRQQRHQTAVRVINRMRSLRIVARRGGCNLPSPVCKKHRRSQHRTITLITRVWLLRKWQPPRTTTHRQHLRMASPRLAPRILLPGFSPYDLSTWSSGRAPLTTTPTRCMYLPRKFKTPIN